MLSEWLDDSMPMTPARRVTFGAMMVAVAVVLTLATRYLPLVGLVTAIFMPLPFVLMQMRTGTGLTLTSGAALFLLVMIIAGGPVPAVSAVVLSVPVGMAMGWGLNRGLRSEWTTLVAGVAVFGATLVSVYLTTRMLGIDVHGQLRTQMEQSINMAVSTYHTLGIKVPAGSIQTMRQSMDLFLGRLFWGVMGMAALFWAGLIYWGCGWAMRRLGLDTPTLGPMSAWELPPGASWLMAIPLGASLLTNTVHAPWLNTLASDSFYVLGMVFLVQGMAVLSFVMDVFKLGKLPRVLVWLLIFEAGFLAVVVAWAGLVENAVSIRQFVKQRWGDPGETDAGGPG